MLRSRVALTVLVVASTPQLLEAQHPDRQCTTPAAVGQGLEGGDACQQAIDLVRFLSPQLGMLIAGGNATLGQADALGGLGRLSLTLRVNATGQLRIPRLEGGDISVGPAQRRSYDVSEQTGGFPVADVAIGLFKGFSVGPFDRAGGVDALVNVFYVPRSLFDALDAGDFVAQLPGSGLKLGYGARLGLLGETRTLPGISITYIDRALPTVSATASKFAQDLASTTSDTIWIESLAVRTAAWRVVVGKRLRIFALAVGAGQDRYSTSGDIRYTVYPDGAGAPARGRFRVDAAVTGNNMFADLSVSLFVFRIVAEVGRVSGAAAPTFNHFVRSAGDAQIYGAIGLSFVR